MEQHQKIPVLRLDKYLHQRKPQAAQLPPPGLEHVSACEGRLGWFGSRALRDDGLFSLDRATRSKSQDEDNCISKMISDMSQGTNTPLLLHIDAKATLQRKPHGASLPQDSVAQCWRSSRGQRPYHRPADERECSSLGT